jgi:hypothetical protein
MAFHRHAVAKVSGRLDARKDGDELGDALRLLKLGHTSVPLLSQPALIVAAEPLPQSLGRSRSRKQQRCIRSQQRCCNAAACCCGFCSEFGGVGGAFGVLKGVLAADATEEAPVLMLGDMRIAFRPPTPPPEEAAASPALYLGDKRIAFRPPTPPPEEAAASPVLYLGDKRIAFRPPTPPPEEAAASPALYLGDKRIAFTGDRGRAAISDLNA